MALSGHKVHKDYRDPQALTVLMARSGHKVQQALMGLVLFPPSIMETGPLPLTTPITRHLPLLTLQDNRGHLGQLHHLITIKMDPFC